MPLTPADVHNVAFSKPPIGKRGYNEDEVDAFLDLVENELTRLIEENADLRQRVSELDQELAGARSGGAQPPRRSRSTSPSPSQSRWHSRLRGPGARGPPGGPVLKTTSPAAKVLSLAQDTADRLTGSAKAESEKLLSDARAQADALVSEARHTAETTLPMPGSAPTPCCPTRRPGRRPSCARRRRRPTHCRPTPSASIPRSWEPSTSSGRCSKDDSSSCAPSSASTAPA